MAAGNKIQNFSSLIKYNFYKVTSVESFKTNFTSNQVVYTLNDGCKLFGRVGINKIFGAYTAPFYFQFNGQATDELFKRYKFNTYKDSEELVAKNHDEILEILINYISNEVCEGCKYQQPNQPDLHSCILETRIEQAKQFLTVALDEHQKYDVGDIVDAFVDFRTHVLV